MNSRMLSVLKKIATVGLVALVVLGGVGVAGAQNTKCFDVNGKQITDAADSADCSNVFDVSEVLKLPGQEAPKFLGNQKQFEKSEKIADAPIVLAILEAINLLMTIIGSFALLMMVAGGALVMLDLGNERLQEQGKNMFFYSLVGVAVAFSSFIIATFVQSVISGF